MNNHITKEGIVNDLKAMKKAGINWVLLGSDIVSGSEFGPVKVFSPEWYEAMHTMLKTATELDIEVGLFNCPGWSQSGGPWIKPENSMRYLASSETRVKGPVRIEQRLPQPTEHFQDVKVLAVPVTSNYMENLLQDKTAKLTCANGVTSNPSQTDLPVGESFLEWDLAEEQVARSLVILPAGSFNANIELQVKDGEQYRKIKRFGASRHYGVLQLSMGFDLHAPITVSFPEVKAKTFRLVFRKTKENSSIKDIILTATPVIEHYSEKTFAKMNASTWSGFLWDRQAEVQNVTVAAPQQVLDISHGMNRDGVLTWDVPAGDWLILRTGMAPTNVTNTPPSPEGKGLEVDKMSKEHLAMHFDAFIGEIMRRIPAEDRKALKKVVQDSYETGGQNFTDGMIDEFKARYGYDPVPFFPAYSGHVIGSPDLSDRFLWDVRRLVADKIAYDYVGGMREISHEHGLITWLENYGHWGFPAEFLQYGGQSDEVSAEFWSTGGTHSGFYATECRLASSCAHIYGKKRVYAESFTSSGFVYGRHPGYLKPLGDWSFAEGINSTVLTLFIHQPYEDLYPGVDAWFGSEFHRKNTWFDQADVYLQYLKRCNLMLQQGLNVADVAYFIGEDTPKMDGIRDPELPKGYSFDYINAEVIIRDMTVKDGKLLLPHGTTYRVLALPPMETMTPELLQKIEQLAADGAVIVGQPPMRAPGLKNYPQADEQVKQLAKKMWDDAGEATEENGSLRIAHVCDPQLGFGRDGFEADVKRFEQLVEQVNARMPDVVLIAGDLVNVVNDSSVSAFKDLLAKFQSPVILTPGNHDVPDPVTEESLKRYRETFGDDFVAWEGKGYLILSVNSQLWRQAPEEETKKQEQKLRQALKEAKEKKLSVILMTHVPPFVDEPEEKDQYFNLSQETRMKWLTLAKEGGAFLWLSGHTHRTGRRAYNGITLLNGETTSQNFDGHPFGFRLLTVCSDQQWDWDFQPLQTAETSATGKRSGDMPRRKRVYGKGQILSGMTMREIFAWLNVTPDFKVDNEAPILYNHRTVNGKEIYFVTNQSDQPVTIRPEFRVKGLQPELWDAVTGEIRLLPAFEQKGETTAVPLKLEAYESAFIVFRQKGKPTTNDVAANFPEPKVKIPVNGAWNVRFESDEIKRGTPETVVFSELKDWTQSEDERIRHYSGTAAYTTSFHLKEPLQGTDWYLDLGKVSVMAKVKVNGMYAGGVWTAPYRVNVTQYLKPGENTLEVEVVNTWVNRIIGDLNLPDEQRKVRPRNNSWRADSPLQSSGLLGPAELQGYESSLR
jgi:Icc-related predicted phosphoesterase